MSKASWKMLGLVMMVASVFVLLFGMHPPAGAPGFAAPLLVVFGTGVLLVGVVFYHVVKRDD